MPKIHAYTNVHTDKMMTLFLLNCFISIERSNTFRCRNNAPLHLLTSFGNWKLCEYTLVDKNTITDLKSVVNCLVYIRIVTSWANFDDFAFHVTKITACQELRFHQRSFQLQVLREFYLHLVSYHYLYNNKENIIKFFNCKC